MHPPPAVVDALWRAAHRDAQGAGATAADELERMSAAVQVLLVFCGVRGGARLDTAPQGTDLSLRRAVGRLAKAHPRRLRVLDRGQGEPLVVNPSLCDPRDLAVLAAAPPGASDLAEPLSGAMGRLLGYRCAYELPARPDGPLVWAARGTIELSVYLMVDGVEHRHPVQLAAFGCGPSVTPAAFERLAARMREDWRAAANRALAGTRCTTPDGRAWVITRFVTTVGEAGTRRRPQGKPTKARKG